MRLITKLWIAVGVFLGFAFIGALLISLMSMRNSIEAQLSVKNVDNANTIASVLSGYKGDFGMMEVSLIDFFDRGHYAHLRLNDPAGKALFRRGASPPHFVSPSWFRTAFPIESRPASAQIMNGWGAFGTIELASDAAPAIDELWRIAVGLYFWISLMAALMAVALAVLLRKVLAPLTLLSQQASDISERRIREIPLPRTADFLPLANSMNTMARRLKAMFEEEGRRLDEMREMAYTDELTGLNSASHFRSRLFEALEGRDHISSGTLILIRINNLNELNVSMGREFVDQMIKRLGQIVGRASEADDALAGRMTGSDLCLLLPGPIDGAPRHKELQTSIAQCCTDLGLENCPVQMGRTFFGQATTCERLLSVAEHSLVAGSTGPVSTLNATDPVTSSTPVSPDEWRKAITSALENHALTFSSFPVCALDGKLIHEEKVLRLQLPHAASWHEGGTIIPWVRQLNMEAMLDLAVIKLAFKTIKESHRPVAINMLAASLSSNDFVRDAKTLLSENQPHCSMLSIEFSANDVFSHLDGFRAASLWLRDSGITLGIEHFGHHSEQIRMIDGLGVSYLKVDYSFLQDFELSASHRSFLGGLCVMTKALGLAIIGEGISSEKERRFLGEIGFDGVTGPAITIP